MLRRKFCRDRDDHPCPQDLTGGRADALFNCGEPTTQTALEMILHSSRTCDARRQSAGINGRRSPPVAAKKSKAEVITMPRMSRRSQGAQPRIKGMCQENAAARSSLHRRRGGRRGVRRPALTDFCCAGAGTRSGWLPQTGLEDLTVAERRILKRIAAGQTRRDRRRIVISPARSSRTGQHLRSWATGSNRLLQFALENRDASASSVK